MGVVAAGAVVVPAATDTADAQTQPVEVLSATAAARMPVADAPQDSRSIVSVTERARRVEQRRQAILAEKRREARRLARIAARKERQRLARVAAKKEAARQARLAKQEAARLARLAAAREPSEWEGDALVTPSGGSFPAEVERWANMTTVVMEEHDIPSKYLPGILAQMQAESGGDPDVVNDWDSNASAGTPSKGLMQVIGPTYESSAKSGYESLKFHTQPYYNMWAALNYVKERYGMTKFDSWNSGSNAGY